MVVWGGRNVGLVAQLVRGGGLGQAAAAAYWAASQGAGGWLEGGPGELRWRLGVWEARSGCGELERRGWEPPSGGEGERRRFQERAS